MRLYQLFNNTAIITSFLFAMNTSSNFVVYGQIRVYNCQGVRLKLNKRVPPHHRNPKIQKAAGI